MTEDILPIQKTRTSTLPILLVNFIGALGYSLILPFLIVLVLKFGGNEMIYGILGATYSFFQFIGAPILGKWSDTVGRKKILLLSQVGTFVAWVLFLVALLVPNTVLVNVESAFPGAFLLSIPLLLLFAARALDGITGGNISVANAYMSDISTDDTRKSNFGKMAASANLGFIIGPAMAGVLGATILGEILPVVATMLISLIAIGVIKFYLEESTPCDKKDMVQTGEFKKIYNHEQRDCYEPEVKEKLGFFEVIKQQYVGFILILYFLIFLSFNFFYVSFPIHAVQGLGWELFELGIFFSVMGAVMVLVQGPVLSWLADKAKESTLIILGSFLLALCFYLFTFDELWMVYTAVILFSTGNGIMWPSFLSVLSKIGGGDNQGAIQGYASSTGSLASIFGMIAGGLIYGAIGSTIFLFPGIVMVLIALLSARLIRI